MKPKIYLADIDEYDNDFYEKAYEFSSGIRKNKTDRLKNERDRRCSLMAEMLIKYALSDWNDNGGDCGSIDRKTNAIGDDHCAGSCKTNVVGDDHRVGERVLSSDSIVRPRMDDGDYMKNNACYCLTENGKPYFRDMSSFCFSISHSGKYVICAVYDKEIGCDIQMIKRSRPGRYGSDYVKMAQRFFAVDEYEMLIASCEPQKEFFRIWSRKESYVKALGSTIADTVAVSLLSRQVTDHYRIDDVEFTDDHVICVCTHL